MLSKLIELYFRQLLLNGITANVMSMFKVPQTYADDAKQHPSGYLVAAMMGIPHEDRERIFQEAMFIGEAIRNGNVTIRISRKIPVPKELFNNIEQQ